jgi:peptidoglycan/xylan/chitin deacetylase (PgdA/CDA1 family)
MHTQSLALLAALLVATVAHANEMNLTDAGIVIHDGAGGKVTLNYPRACDAAKKPIKISEKTIDGKTATLKFEGGGQSVIDVSSGSIVVKNTDIPATTKVFQTSILLPFSYTDGGTFSTGEGELPFPAEKSSDVHVAKGSQRDFVIKTKAGGKVAINIPAYGYQQIQDHRHFNDAKQFQWTAWINHYPDAGRFTIGVGDAPTAKPRADAKPAAQPQKPELLNPALAAVQQPKSVDGTDILKWKDGKKAAFYLAFDDSCPSHLKTVIPELTQRKITGTFYVIAGGGLFADNPKWAEAAKSPYVVLANHTYTHKGAQTLEQFEEEVTKATTALNEKAPHLKPGRLISYGKPGGVKWGEGVTDAAMKPILAKHNLIDRQPFWGAAIHVKTAADVEKLVDAAITKGEVGHLDFHGVGGDWLACTTEFFIATLDKLEKHRDEIWVTDPVSAHKYATARKSAELKVVEKGEKQIRISLTSTADAALYDHPLTLATKVPGDWTSVQITQGEAKSTAAAKEGVVMYHALPGGGEILLTPAP